LPSLFYPYLSRIPEICKELLAGDGSPRCLLSARSAAVFDPSYKFSSRLYNFRGRLELLYAVGHHIDTATHRERHRRATHLGTLDLRGRASGRAGEGEGGAGRGLGILRAESASVVKRVRVADTCRIMGGTLMDGVWVPPGTMEPTSPSYHPSLSESFIAARYMRMCIYIYIYIYPQCALLPPFQTSPLPRRTCILCTRISN